MKVSDLFVELLDRDCYKKFIDAFSGSFLCAGFFILDLKEKSEKVQLDFFVPSKRRVVGFEFPFSDFKMFDDEMKGMKELHLDDLKVDLDDLEGVCNEIIKRHDSALKPTKIIAVLKGDEWNLTCMDDMLGIVRIKVNAFTGEEISFDKGSLMDFMGFKKV